MSTQFHLLSIMLTLFVGVHSAFSQPTLGIAPTNNQAILFWTNGGGTNGALQSCTDLASPNWVSVTDAVTANYALQAAVSVTNSSSARFFRLSMVPPTTDGMALIPTGWFTMGDAADTNLDGDASRVNIYVSAFYMDTNLVSYSLWQTVYEYATNNGYGFDDAGAGKAANHPVQAVDWYDCVKWCNARSQQAGKTPVYYTDAGLTQVYETGDVTPYVNWEVSGYRLPTEAEWEKAAWGGLSAQRFPRSETISESQANYQGDTKDHSYDLGPNGFNPIGDPGDAPPLGPEDVFTSPVGSFAANGYGLYDMAGNVDEWCWDWYGTPYGQPTTTNPTGPISGWFRVLRGGGWYNFAINCRTAYRNGNYPAWETHWDGFRSVLPAGP